MAISYGPKLGLINNALIGENYVDAFRVFLQAIDELVQMSVISSTVNVPPATPNNGDAYLLLQPSPSGAWTGFFGYIAVWNTQVTTSGTNTQVPAWVFYKPNPGWLIWVIATNGLFVYNGSAWTPLVSGGTQAEVPLGPINGSNVNFTLSYSPTPIGSLSVYVNGVFQLPTINYILSGTNLSMVIAPNSGSTLYAVYDYV